jgi:hypothetical protein
MELVAHWRLSKQALIDLVFFCGVPIVLAMLSGLLGPYAAVMGAAGAAVYVLSLAIVPWWLTGLVTQWVSKTAGRSLPLWLIAAIGATAAGPRVAVRVCRQFGRGRHLARSGRLAAGDVQRGTYQIRRLVRGAGHRSLDRLCRHFP